MRQICEKNSKKMKRIQDLTRFSIQTRNSLEMQQYFSEFCFFDRNFDLTKGEKTSGLPLRAQNYTVTIEPVIFAQGEKNSFGETFSFLCRIRISKGRRYSRLR